MTYAIGDPAKTQVFTFNKQDQCGALVIGTQANTPYMLVNDLVAGEGTITIETQD